MFTGMEMKSKYIFLLIIYLCCFGCSSKEENSLNDSELKEVTIFHINDQHGQLDNFSKIKHIIDREREHTNVIVVCSGDMFSGNPVVDNHSEKGYPMIDVMNRVGFDVTVLGNHEFDYGVEILGDRMQQADFEWICANVDMGSTGIPSPATYTTLSVDDIKITLLGLVETNGKKNDIIPSTHPWKVGDFTFTRPEDVVAQYADIKELENSDLYIALTHLGHDRFNGTLGDYQLAAQYPFFDLIIGGHSHQVVNTTINQIPVFQAGSNLNFLGKIALTIKNRSIEDIDYQLIELNSYSEYDAGLKALIDEYNNWPFLDEIIGYSHIFHDYPQVGCFYTDALREKMQVDVTFQNTGGVRSTLNMGDISNREIFEIAPFNNGTVIYTLSVLEIKQFLKGAVAGFFYAGIEIEQNGAEIFIKTQTGEELEDDVMLSVGINDYIAAVYENYFTGQGTIQGLTAAETIIAFLKDIDDQVNYPECLRYFRYE